MQYVVPALRVSSYNLSVEFYKKLGFKERWRHQANQDAPLFASIIFDNLEIFLTEHIEDCSIGGLVHFYVDDVDFCYSQFKAHKLPIDQPPSSLLGEDIRDMVLIDPDGNRLVFLTITTLALSDRITIKLRHLRKLTISTIKNILR